MKKAYTYTDWDRVRERAHEGRYLFCSCERMDDPDGSWLRGFRKEAADHGARIEVSSGHVFVVFDS